jgi:hypothetical protein
MLDSCMDYVLFENLRHELSIFTLPHSFPFFTNFRRHFSKNTTGLPSAPHRCKLLSTSPENINVGAVVIR